jgi:hypothetical protein
MWKAALVGAVALTTGTISLAYAQSEPQAASYEQSVPEHGAPILTEAHIARLKSTLHLTPGQHAYWAPVEAALRALAREQRREVAGSMLSRMSDSASAMAGTAMGIRRLAAAAGPLIRVLDDDQKQRAMTLARRFGFERLIASF